MAKINGDINVIDIYF